ncbi:MAG: helix-turn-helix transcriptional regulator [Myxococcota bacterium]
MDKRLAAALGAAARAARQRADLTQADVAERLDISPDVYGRLERGVMLPSVETLRRLCLVLGVSADDLLGLEATRSAVFAAEPGPVYAESSGELRRLLRRARKLDPRRQRLIGLLAKELAALPRSRR